MQVVHDLQLYRKTSTVSLIFFHAKEAKEGVSHTVRARKTRENVEKVWEGHFLSYGRLKLPSSINKPVPGSKVVGKWNEKKSRNFESWLTNEHFLLHQLHGVSKINVCFSPVKTDALLTMYI